MKLTALFLVSLAATQGFAIVRRDDRPDARYIALAKQFPAVVVLPEGGSGVLVAPQWVLTAGHAARQRSALSDKSIRIGGQTYRIAGYAQHPQFKGQGVNDVGLVKLDRPVRGVQPMPLYGSSAPFGMKTIIVGAGMPGKGSTGVDSTRGARVIRAATNMLEKPSESGPNYVAVFFDKGPKATDLEGIGAPGDSGGPALVQAGGQWQVVAVGTAGNDLNGNNVMADYGDESIYARVAPFKQWIQTTVQQREVASEPSQPAAKAWSNTSNQPAYRVASEFFKAFNSGEEAVTRFNATMTVPSGRTPEQRLALYRRLKKDFGDLTPIQYVLTASGIQVSVRGTTGSATFDMVMRDGKLLSTAIMPGR